MRPAVFVGGLIANADSDTFRRTLTNAGGQLDFQLTTLSSLDMMVSVGAAMAFEEGEPRRHEYMVSFKVLK